MVLQSITVYLPDPVFFKSFEHVIRIFDFRGLFRLVRLHTHDSGGLKAQIESIDQRFRVAGQDEVLVDLSQIIQHLDLKNYDPNLKYFSGN